VRQADRRVTGMEPGLVAVAEHLIKSALCLALIMDVGRGVPTAILPTYGPQPGFTAGVCDERRWGSYGRADADSEVIADRLRDSRTIDRAYRTIARTTSGGTLSVHLAWT
jgi:hypothetical protein